MLSVVRSLRVALLCSLAVFVLAASRASVAADIDASGYYSYSIDFAWDSANMYVDRIDNVDYSGYSGTIRLELWLFPSPYNGSSQYGYKIAQSEIGQLYGGYYFSSIDRTASVLVTPPYDYYYPSILVSEYTYSGWATRDHLNFNGQYGGVSADTDSDGWYDGFDNCRVTYNPSQSNIDSDIFGDACDPCPVDFLNDADLDGRCANVDNCPVAYNPSQSNADGDAFGDACDSCPSDRLNDADADGLCGGLDNCPSAYNPGQEDLDSDSLGDACDACPSDPGNDDDSDGLCGGSDNCPAASNPTQSDLDGDGLGDACDLCPLDQFNDLDADGRCADQDNCPTDSNPDQSDLDADHAGDVCDPTPAACSDGEDNDGDGLYDYPADPGCTALLDNTELNAPGPPCVTCDEHLILSGTASLDLKKAGKEKTVASLSIDLATNTWVGVDANADIYGGSFVLDRSARKLSAQLDSASLVLLQTRIEERLESLGGIDVAMEAIIPSTIAVTVNKDRTIAKLKAKFRIAGTVLGVRRTGSYSLSLVGPIVRGEVPR